ncbi:hypothetical protein PPERSA_05308 [Pseudocohnilembus persalinus]|uniref:folate gamma-glutamyl hydrolase n=1 Tax=Pseudocohnilembus persalinus TaxID=266149 RepID=A0A0V0R617_PSEPJ|nr:hypothetical protein PPERSA_05308 [Pseudocohnilembus persalinus]|eukprot:KRX09916.1 hypothetical protein PPERSA_05308 [Pseudocohnilembus persalinus]
MQKLQILLLLALSVTLTVSINTTPYIGIWSQPSSYDDEGYPSDEYSYIAASYVKYIEMAGARVIPVLYDGDQEYYDNLLNQLNGVLFTGGDADISKGTTFGTNAQYFYNKVKELNDKGTYFPLWGTCMGFQLLMNLANNLDDTLTHIDGDGGVNHVISIQNPGTLYANMPQILQENAQQYTIQYFNHQWCVSIDTYNKNKNLKNFYNLLATAANDDGDEFVTTIQAYNYPFYGVQFHPEKANFEWKVPANHTLDAVLNSQYYADFFVQECRQNNQQFISEELADSMVIYNFQPVHLESSSFEQIYFFENFSNSKNNQQEILNIHSEKKKSNLRTDQIFE